MASRRPLSVYSWGKKEEDSPEGVLHSVSLQGSPPAATDGLPQMDLPQVHLPGALPGQEQQLSPRRAQAGTDATVPKPSPLAAGASGEPDGRYASSSSYWLRESELEGGGDQRSPSGGAPLPPGQVEVGERASVDALPSHSIWDDADYDDDDGDDVDYDVEQQGAQAEGAAAEAAASAAAAAESQPTAEPGQQDSLPTAVTREAVQAKRAKDLEEASSGFPPEVPQSPREEERLRPHRSVTAGAAGTFQEAHPSPLPTGDPGLTPPPAFWAQKSRTFHEGAEPSKAGHHPSHLAPRSPLPSEAGGQSPWPSETGGQSPMVSEAGGLSPMVSDPGLTPANLGSAVGGSMDAPGRGRTDWRARAAEPGSSSQSEGSSRRGEGGAPTRQPVASAAASAHVVNLPVTAGHVASSPSELQLVVVKGAGDVAMVKPNKGGAMALFRKKESPSKPQKTLASLEIVLDPSKTVQWFGDWDDGELLVKSKIVGDAFTWSSDDVVVLPGLAGQVSIPALMDHTVMLLVIGMLLCACGGAFIGLNYAHGPVALPFLVAAMLLVRALVLGALAMILWYYMEASELGLACSFPWLDFCAAVLLIGLTIAKKEIAFHICIGSWLVARGVWLEGMALVCGWNEKGREWWLALISIWPPVVVGALLIAGIPMVIDWYTLAVLAACCFIDGIPLWITAATVRVQMLDGSGIRPEFARNFVEHALGVSCFAHGVLRISLIILCSVAFYVAS